MNFLSISSLRAALLPLLLLGLLSSCAVYDSVFHPHRLPTPKMDAVTKAKIKAAEKARHKGTTLKAAEEATDGGDPSTPSSGGTDEKKKPMSYSDLPEGTRIKYDKQGLVRKSFLDRRANDGRKLHHYDTRPLTPREASRENRQIRKKGHTDGHGSGEAAPRDPAPADRAPAPAPPAASPAAPAEASPPQTQGKKAVVPTPDPTQPAPAPPTKAKKASKVPVPKPDPTQPAGQ